MSIRIKVLIPLLACLLLGAVASGFIGLRSLSGIADLASLSGKAITAADASRVARDGFDGADQIVSRVVAMTDLLDPDAIQPRFKAQADATAAALADLKTAALSPAMAEIAQTAVDRFTAWRRDAEVLLGIERAGEIATLDLMRRNGEGVRSQLDRAVTLAGRDARTRIEAETASLGTELRAVFGVALGVAGLAAAGAFLVARNLSAPLRALVASAQRLAAGDVSVRIGALERRDEVGEIARAVDVFRANVTAQATAEAEAVEQRRLGTDERRRSDLARAASSQEQEAVVQAIAAALEALARGDLTRELSSFPSAYQVLQTDYNTAIAQLRQAMGEVAGNTRTIRSGTRHLSVAADDLSGKTEQQSTGLERTAQSLDRITKAVRGTANGAKHAHDVVTFAKSEAEATGSVVRDAVAAMGSIETCSRQIGQIIGVIDEIAFQTNLLALNAGVEAARAGDAGRGFAVVASEVRGLAQRSAEAAKEIKALVSNSARQIGSGVDLVRRTGGALERILEQVVEINGIVTSISVAANEQAAGLDEVNAAVADMGRITQNNAGLVDQSADACRDLASEADKLAELVARFTVAQSSKTGVASGVRARTGRAFAVAA